MCSINYKLVSPLSLLIESVTTSLCWSFTNITDSSPAFAFDCTMPGIINVPRFRKRLGTTRHAKASGQDKYQDLQTGLQSRIHDFRQE